MPGPLATIIRLNSGVLQAHLDRAAINLDAQKLLLALVGCESSFGANCKPRHEPAHDTGGKYHSPAWDTPKWRADWIPNPCAHSYTSFQMMFTTAHELGYDGHWKHLANGWHTVIKNPLPDPPLSSRNYDWMLLEDSNAGDWIVCPLVCEFWRLRVIEKGHKSLEDFADAYNSGSVGGFIPTDYIKKFVDYYKQNVGWLESKIV